MLELHVRVALVGVGGQRGGNGGEPSLRQSNPQVRGTDEVGRLGGVRRIQIGRQRMGTVFYGARIHHSWELIFFLFL